MKTFPSISPKRVILSVTNVHSVEEELWSSTYGLKGRIDASIEVQIHPIGRLSKTHRHVPLEIKTGFPSRSAEHIAQTILYAVLMEERYGEPCPDAYDGGCL